MGEATLRRSVYTKFGGYYPKGATVVVDTIDMTNDRISIKKPKYDGPIRISLKAKDLIFKVKWKQLI
jgi:hypothetical protein